MSSKAQIQVKQGAGATPSFTPAPTALLQRACACGNHAGVDGACTECKSKRLTGEQRPLVQAKLTVNRPGDRYEQEADRIADQVMRMPEPQVQRQPLTEEEEEDETLQMKPLSSQITPLVQRETIPEEEDEEEEIALQRQPLTEEEEDEGRLLQAKATTPQAPALTPAIEGSIQSLRQGGGRPLDPATRAFMEPRFGHDFGQVRVHMDLRAAAAARAVNSRAFTVGNDVIFGAGQYTPKTTAGQRLLAHELAHTVQQTIQLTQSNARHSLQHLLAQRTSTAQGPTQVEERVARGIDISELDTGIQLPSKLGPDVRQRHSATRTLSVRIDEMLPGKVAVSDISKLQLLEGDETHAAKLAVEYSLRVSPGLAEDQDSWNRDTVVVGGDSPALRPHEEAHLRVKQLAVRSELGRHPEAKSVASLDDSLRVLQDSASRAKEIEGFVSAKMDVKTQHGEYSRPEKRFERERKIIREIQKAERLRDRNEARFNRRLDRLKATSSALLPEELRE